MDSLTLASPLLITQAHVNLLTGWVGEWRDLLGSNCSDGGGQKGDSGEEVNLGPGMVLHQRRVRQLDANRVVHCNEDEKQRVRHKVLLPVITEQLIVLASLLINLDGCHVDRFVTDKSASKPNSRPEPVAQELDEELQKVDIFNLCGQRLRSRFNDFDETIELTKLQKFNIETQEGIHLHKSRWQIELTFQ